MFSHCSGLCCSLLPLAAPHIPEMLSCHPDPAVAKKPQPGQGTVQGGICPSPGKLGTCSDSNTQQQNLITFSWQCWKQFRKPSTGICGSSSARSPSNALTARSAQRVPSPRKIQTAQGRNFSTKTGLSLSAEFCQNWERARWDGVWDFFF